MAHLQYMPGDPRLVDQLVYELKSKGIFDQFRKECIADVDTRPAYQNLRQRVETSVSTFLSRQTWKSDLNKNQLREKLRKHILDGNYLEQGVERIVDQVVNPKVASVFIPQVEDLVYNYLGIPRKKTPKTDQAEKSADILLPTDLEAVSPGSVKSNDEESRGSENKVQDMDIDSEEKPDTTEDMSIDPHKDDLVEVSSDSASLDKSSIPLPTEEIKLENIPAPEDSPKPAKVEIESIELPSSPIKPAKIELKNIDLPREPNLSADIPLPDEITVPKQESNTFKPINLPSEDSNSSSGSSIRRNMSPLTPVRNFDDENSCDAQQAFEDNSEQNTSKEPSSFRFNIEPPEKTNDNSEVKTEKKETEQLSYQFSTQANINTFNTPLYDDSSNSHNLQIDYESDANTNTSKTTEVKNEVENSEDSKKERKDDKKNHKSSHSSRDSSRHSSSKDKHSNSRDSSRHNKKPSSKDDKSKSSKEREKSRDRSDKKDSSKHKSSHKSSSSSKDKHRSSSSSHRHSSKSSDDRKSSHKDSSSKEKSSEKDKERSSDKEKSSKDRKDSKSSSHRDKDRKSSKKDDKDKKKEKKDTDDHYSSSGRGNHSRRSTDRDSNDGSSSSKGSQSRNNSKSTESKKESKSSSSKSDNTSTSGESTSPSDKEQIVSDKLMQCKPIVRVDNHLETPIANPPRLPFVPDVTLKKPKFANNLEEAKKMMKMRKFLAEEQKRMNQEAALLLEFQANVRPSLSQVYSSIPGPELEFACHTEPEAPQKKKKEDKENMKAEQSVEKEFKDKVIEKSQNTEEYLERKQVTKDIINDIIGVPIEDTEHTNEIIFEPAVEIPNYSVESTDSKNDDSYNENKPFLQPVDEVSEYGKSFEISIDPLEESIAEIVDQNISSEIGMAVRTETLSEADVSEILENKEDAPKLKEKELQYFAEHEKFNAELEKHKFSNFLKEFIEATNVRNKMYLINCDTYEEKIVQEMASKFGEFEIVNYYKNGHLVPSTNVVKDVPLSTELSLPLDTNEYEIRSPLFSPVKSECSFDLSSDYDAKLDEIVNKKSRQEVMEIILGGIIDESPSRMPCTIDYYTEISDSENALTVVEDVEVTESPLKRKINEENLNINRSVLTPNKIRKMSDSDQISSTTEETDEVSNNNKIQSRSKYLGRAKRVGLPRPKRCTLPNSPSSDKSVENYVQNTPTPPNGKLKATPRSKVQRYDTSDLYKPKLHYLSRRNNIS